MSKLKLICAISVGLGVVAVGFVGYLAMIGQEEPAAAAVAHQKTKAAVDLARPNTVKNPPVTELSRSLADPTPEVPPLDDIAYACPDFDVSTDVCIAALDRRYLGLAPSSVYDGIIEPIMEPDRPMTLRRVFEDPAGKRTAIEDAWNDPVCNTAWPPNGASEGWSGTIRRDLGDRCQADAMAEFSVLVELCATHSGYLRRANANRESTIERLELIEDNQAYWEKHAASAGEHRRKMWLAEKCRRTGPGTLAPLGESIYTGDGFLDFLNYLGDVYSLERRAAWLGQEWAMAQYRDSHRPRTEEYVPALRSADSIRYHIHEAYRLRGDQAALTHVLAASKLALRRGVKIDSNALFELVGAYSLEDLEAADRQARELLGRSDDQQ